MRIDVDRDTARIESELDVLYEQLQTAGMGLVQDDRPPPHPGLVVQRRTADGEHYVYVVDVAARCLAGCTVFNRLVEVDRKTDRFVRSPHSKYRPAYQRLGLASHVYRRELDAGRCLVSGARQSDSAHALWQALARRYTLGYVELRSKTLSYLGRTVSGDVRDELTTRMILFGRGGAAEPSAHDAGGPAGHAACWSLARHKHWESRR